MDSNLAADEAMTELCGVVTHIVSQPIRDLCKLLVLVDLETTANYRRLIKV